MKALLKFFTITVLALTSVSYCQAMDPQEKFQAFSRKHPQLDLDRYLSNIRNFTEEYTLADNVQTREQQLDQHAVLNACISYYSTVSSALSNWKSNANFKLCPNRDVHSPVHVALSVRTKPAVTAIGATLKASEAFLDNTYAQISAATLTTELLLNQADMCITTLNEASRLITEFIAQEKIIAENPAAAAIAAERSPLEIFLEQDFFALNVLNEAMNQYNSLGGYSPTTRQTYIDNICDRVELAEASWRTEELFRAKVTEILDDNFSR